MEERHFNTYATTYYVLIKTNTRSGKEGRLFVQGAFRMRSCGGEPEARPVYISGTQWQLQRVREVSRIRVSEQRSCWGIELLKSHASGCPSCLRVGKNMYFRSLSIPTLCNAVKFYRIWLDCLFRETIVVFTNFLVVPRGITCAANVLPCPRHRRNDICVFQHNILKHTFGHISCIGRPLVGDVGKLR